MCRTWCGQVALALMMTMGAVEIGRAQSSQTPHGQGDTYTWSGELVSVDKSAATVTVKSRVAYQDALSELKQFKPGDKVLVVWSGLHDYSDAVRQVRRFESGRQIADTLMLPAEFVSTEAPNQYVTVRVKVPQSSLAAVGEVKPGDWVTVTSRHRPSTEADAVVAVRPYSSPAATKGDAESKPRGSQ